MFFGVGEFKRLGELASKYGSKPLVVFGRKSARESGLIDRANDLLAEAGLEPVVFEGIESNPRFETCQKGAKLASESGCDMVIGIGGGSVMDASKAIAFGFHDPDGMWRRIAHWEENFEPVDKALPIILVSTLAATGSEGDSGGVITNTVTNDKVAFFGEALFPKISIIDPELTLTTPLDYTRDGAVDMTIHVMESYFNGEDVGFSDRATEGFFVEVIEALEAVLENPEDIDARTNLSYLGAIALHGFINKPRGGMFPLHMMQHPLSAYFDISHGRGLALLLPRWLKYIGHEKPDKIIQLGERVFSMELETHHPFEAVDKVIGRIIEWLEDIGAWFFMDNLGIPNDVSLFEKMADDILRVHGKDGIIDGLKPLGKEDIVEIYKMCLRPAAPAETAFPVDETSDDEATDEETEDGEIVEVIEEIIVIEEGEELPEAKEGEEIIIIEEIVEEEEPEK